MFIYSIGGLNMAICMHMSVHIFKEYAYIYMLNMTSVFYNYNGFGFCFVFVFFMLLHCM